MKSIKQQYIDLQEGKMTQQNFMRNLRMTLPQYITNVTSYKDSIRILKNKGILSEILDKTVDELMASNPAGNPEEEAEMKSVLIKKYNINPEQLKMGIDVEMEHTNNSKIAEKIAIDHLKEDPEYYTKLTKAGLEENDDDDEAEIEAMIKKAEEEKAGEEAVMGQYDENLNEAKSWTNASGKELYAQFKEIDNLNGQEVLIGIDFEMEQNHELSKIEAAKIVVKKLKKNPLYYTATLMAGKEMNEIPTISKFKPGSDKMRPIKGEDSLVDKDNGMKLVKDVAKVKASANKASKETNKPEGTISLMSLVAKASRGVEKMTATSEKMKVVKESNDNRELSKKIAGLGINAEKWNAMSHNEKLHAIDNNRFIPQSMRLQAVKMDWNELTNNFDGVRQGFAFPKKSETKPGVNLGKADLMKMIREELAEMLSNQQETDDVALGVDETFDGRDNLTDVTGENK